MSVEGGQYAAVNGVSSLRQWQISTSSALKKFVASNTKGGAGRRRGIRDWSGNYSAYGGSPDVLPKDLFAFTGYTAPNTGIEGGTGPTYIGNAIVDSIQINWSWETGEIVAHTVNFSGNGEIVESTGAITDETPFVAPSTLSVARPQCRLVGNGSWTDLCITTAQLTLSAENKTYANACTDGWVGRRPGPFDWTMSLNFKNTSFDDIPFAVDDLVEFRMYVNDTEYWSLMWGQIKDFSNLVANRETGDIIGFTVNVEMAGIDDEGNLGNVLTPDGTQLWGDSGSS